MSRSRSILVLTLVLAGCEAEDQRVPDAGQVAEDARLDAEPSALDAAVALDAAPGFEGTGVCVGVGCDVPFDPAEWDSVAVTPAGAIVLADGAAEGEWRHVFAALELCDGAWPMFHSLTLSGKLDGVTAEVRGANTLDALEGVPWQAAATLDEINHETGCGPAFLEVRILLRRPELGGSPRVDTVTLSYGCVSIFC